MDQNPETQNIPEQPVEASLPVTEPPVIELNPEPPLQPEIVGTSYQAPPPKKNSNGWVITLIVLLVVCCCCLVLFIPLLVLGNVLWAVLGGVYSAVISILNSIFGGVIQFY